MKKIGWFDKVLWSRMARRNFVDWFWKLNVLLLLCATNVYASNESVIVQGGWLHTQNSNYGDGVETTVRAETKLIYDLNIGMEYTYHGATSHDPYGDMSGHVVMGDLIYYTPIKVGNSQVYILGGLGWGWWNFDRSDEMAQKQIDITLGNALAKKVGIGCDYKLNDHWSINVEWNYFQSHVPKDSYDNTTGSFANVVTDEATIGQEEANIVVGARYKF